MKSGGTQVTFFNSQPWFYEHVYWPIRPNRHRNTKLTPNLRDKITTEHESELFYTEVVARHDLIYRFNIPNSHSGLDLDL